MDANQGPGTDPVQSVALQPGEGRTIVLGEVGDVTMKVERRHSSGTMSAYEFELAARTAGPPLHIHRSWDELFYVLEGTMTFTIDGVVPSAPAGSVVFIPKGSEHTFWNESELAAKQLTVFTPSGIEDYFDEVSAVLGDADESLEAAIALMQRHDMIVPEYGHSGYGALTPD